MTTTLTVASLAAFILLTIGTAVFVAAEFSLTALERTTVEANARTGGRRDRIIRTAHRNLSFQLSGAQIGISITTLITGYLAEPVVARLLRGPLHAVGLPESATDAVALALALLIATSVSMVFGELVPKNLAVARPVPTARATVPLQWFFSLVFSPVIKLTNGTANWVLRRLGVEPAEELRSARSAQELLALVRTSAESGSLDAQTAQLIDRSLQFGGRTAEELMTPRSTIESLEVTDTVADLIETAIRTGFSRFPIVAGDLDETVGIVHVKQVFAIPVELRASTRLAQLARPVPTVPSTLDGDAVMTQIRANGVQTALVVDEYGGTAGMVTVEDLIEEIVGDVRDEHDDATPDVVEVRDGWLVSGLLRIDEVDTETPFRAPEGDYETIGGLVLKELGHIPAVGDTVVLTEFDPDNPELDPVRWKATVIRMDGRRIDQLELTELTELTDEPGGRRE
ncbi:HlyC/CorC family transporter [Mycobacterium sp. CBMA293]|uniref:hemolysin family protein n=1 Tax=unclassified Mycolicibacterium TaxID=2636767 RepID=UPI00132A7202|nr:MULTISPECIES: hemolysin family protein [unclassified Mycolicibacterium]MUL49146.1 HlyC/CorC family transporter [Mycolicibacterium sp. CBMA 360]MUL93551.1 HlyC/CorC family transporter [Mycolicibacterium sp. CBMA 230]MUM33738.1 HlyC/CorC family transporter [Mycolicibacterium sp. CBMA 361]MUL62135.1 HlyC/CorC family transporter [Mycolicibacterium sp. CBMA 335]MUL71596.1 HlyC/CorC family transporter [Mycolicibacterium sp. CBMA 311]